GRCESGRAGGRIPTRESQLRQQNAGPRLKEVLAEVPSVRKAAGYPPLVTPSSQIVGTQAVLNVLMGPYKTLTGEFADLMLGYYGATLGPRDPAVVAAAAKHARKEPITSREGADPQRARRPAKAGVGRTPRPRLGAEGLKRHRRGRAALRHVPAGRPQVLPSAAKAPGTSARARPSPPNPPPRRPRSRR